MALAPLKVNGPALCGITTASPLVMDISGALAKVIVPEPSRTSATANPAGKSPVPGSPTSHEHA